MTIPPVGASPGSPSPADDKKTQETRPVKSENNNPSSDKIEQISERVELSPDAMRIRDRQSEITQLQIASRTSEAILRDEAKIRELASKLNDSRKTGNREIISDLERDLDQHLKNIKNRGEQAKFNKENLLDGRELRFKIDDQEEKIRTPDARREIRDFEKDIRESVRTKRDPVNDRHFDTSRKFITKATDIRERLERDVRKSIEKAVKDSSGTRVRDASDAEQLLRKAREAKADYDSRQSGMDQISGQAIDLLK